MRRPPATASGTLPYDSGGTADAVCEGPARKNGFYGECIVDALDAVTKK